MTPKQSVETIVQNGLNPSRVAGISNELVFENRDLVDEILFRRRARLGGEQGSDVRVYVWDGMNIAMMR